MEVLKKVLNIVIDIFIVLVVIVSAIIAIISLTARDSGVANLFGYVPFSVQSNSMSPVFETGDLIVGKKVEDGQEYHVGDIITFWTSDEGENGEQVAFLNTHRIINIVEHKYSSGVMYETKGDNNEIKDSTFVRPSKIVAVWAQENQDDGIKIGKLGAVLDFLRKPSGFFIAVVIPMIIFFIYELIRFITNFLNYNKEKQKEAALQAAKELMGNDASDSSGLSEDQKAQAILEYLEKQKAEKEAAPPAEPAAPAESASAEAAEEPAAAEEAPAEAAEEEAPAEAEAAPSEPENIETQETEQPEAEAAEAVAAPEQDETVSEVSED